MDTSAWIDWPIDLSLGQEVERALPERGSWPVPTIVQFERAKWLNRETDEDKVDQVIAFTERCVVVPLDTRLSLAAAEIGARHALAMADAIVYPTARAHDADVLTCDAHFKGLPGIMLIPKTGG